MADKINKEESISRVYQFLNKYNGDWKADADINNDNTIIKTEFRTFLNNSDFQWNGETDQQKEDIITTFWKSIDTQTTGKLNNGKGISDKNALNADELATVDTNIKATDIVVKYMKNMSMPAGIDSKYQTKWKESVKAGMINRAIEFLKNGTLEELTEEKLNEFYGLSSIKATADYKAYTEIDSQLGEYTDLGYAAGDDKVLQGVINEYIAQLEEEGKSENEVLKDIEELVGAYVALATNGNDKKAKAVLSNYESFDDEVMTPLQEAVVNSNMKNSIVDYLSTLKDGEESVYKNNKALFDSAIETFITRTLATASSKDYETLKEYDGASFKDESEFKSAYNRIKAAEIFTKVDMYVNIASEIGQAFADKLYTRNEDGTVTYKLMTGEFPAFDKIKEQALEKAANGDFGDLTQSSQKLIAWIISEIKSNISEFFNNDWNYMTIEDLNITYDILEKSAIDSDRADDLKNAAIHYCKSLVSRTPGLKSLVEKVFGGDYNTFITEHKSGEITDKMKELKQKALEMGDASTFELNDSTWDGLKNILIAEGVGFSFNINPSFKNGVNVPKERIQIVSSNTSIITVDSDGKATVSDKAPQGEHSVTLSVVVDGVTLGSKTIKVEVKTSEECEKLATSGGRSSADYVFCDVRDWCVKWGGPVIGGVVGTVYGAVAGAATAVGNAVADAAEAVWDFITSW